MMGDVFVIDCFVDPLNLISKQIIFFALTQYTNQPEYYDYMPPMLIRSPIFFFPN